MAKKTKTQAIKEALTSFPGAKPQQIVAELRAQGIRVSPAYVSSIKSKLRRGETDMISIEAVEEASRLIDLTGSVAKAKEVLEIVAKLKLS